MDFGPLKTSLEKIPFWDKHKKTPINTSGFRHIDWIIKLQHNNHNRKFLFLATLIISLIYPNINIMASSHFRPYYNIPPTVVHYTYLFENSRLPESCDQNHSFGQSAYI